MYYYINNLFYNLFSYFYYFEKGTFAPKIPERMNKTAIPNTPSKLMNRFKKNENNRLQQQQQQQQYNQHQQQQQYYQTNQEPSNNEIDEQQPQNNYYNHNHNQEGNWNSGHHSPDASFYDNNNNHSNNPNHIFELEAEIQQLQSERDDLLREKKFWLTKIQSDNSKLITLLQVR